MFENRQKGAVFDSDRRIYRYALWRLFEPFASDTSYVAFIGLNPSITDENKDDPALRRCMGFAKSWGYDGLVAAKPSRLAEVEDPVGSLNDNYLDHFALHAQCGLAVACWGANASPGRARVIRNRIPKLHLLGLTQRGAPKRPLYLPVGTKPVMWTR